MTTAIGVLVIGVQDSEGSQPCKVANPKSRSESSINWDACQHPGGSREIGVPEHRRLMYVEFAIRDFPKRSGPSIREDMWQRSRENWDIGHREIGVLEVTRTGSLKVSKAR